MQAKLRPSADPVNDVAFPSGPLLKGYLPYISPLSEGSAGGRYTSILHVCTGTDRCHAATRAVVSTSLPQIGPLLAGYHTVERQPESSGAAGFLLGSFQIVSISGAIFSGAQLSFMRFELESLQTPCFVWVLLESVFDCVSVLKSASRTVLVTQRTSSFKYE